MKRELITRQYSFAGYLMNCIYLLIPLSFLGVAVDSLVDIEKESPILLVCAILVSLAWSIYKPIRANRIISKRQSQISEFALRNSYQYSPGKSVEIMQFGLMSLKELSGARDIAHNNFVSSKDWNYADYSYNTYRKTKHGEYKAATVYYGVMTAKLPRALPNVFFDSRKSRKRQFRFHFSRKQKHSLEGNFDKHFVTYFPEDYTIDSMSFISPDVMWKLIEADDYDIEIRGDRVFMYGPLFQPEVQITDMAKKLMSIKKELLDNILTYRDERLPYKVGRQMVAMQGATLERSKFIKRLTIAGVILYFIVRIAAEIMQNN